MTGTPLVPPAHRGKQAKCLADVSNNAKEKAACAEYLQKRKEGFCSAEQKYRTNEQRTHWQQSGQGFE